MKWNTKLALSTYLILYITFELLAKLATMGAWPKYKHINSWVVN